MGPFCLRAQQLVPAADREGRPRGAAQRDAQNCLVDGAPRDDQALRGPHRRTVFELVERLQGLCKGACHPRLGAHIPGGRLEDCKQQLRDPCELRVAHAVLELEEREQWAHGARGTAQEDRAERVFGMVRERLAFHLQLLRRNGHKGPDVDAHGL